MRKLMALLAGASFALVSTTATAAVFDAGASFLTSKISSNPTQTVMAELSSTGTGTVSLFSTSPVGIGVGGADGAVISTSGLEVGSALFTGTPNITNLFLTAFNTPGGFSAGYTGPSGFPNNQFDGAGPAIGGAAPLAAGSLVIIEALGYLSIPVPLSTVGGGGQATAGVGLLTAKIYVDGGPWVTDTTTITGIASNIVSITADFAGRMGSIGAQFTLSPTVNEDFTLVTENGASALTIAGTNMITASGGSITLVTPSYSDPTDVTAGTPIGAYVGQTLVFVPEPGTMLLLGSAVAGLVLVGRKRMQR